MTTARVFVQEIGYIVNEAGNDDQWSFDSLFLDYVQSLSAFYSYLSKDEGRLTALPANDRQVLDVGRPREDFLRLP